MQSGRRGAAPGSAAVSVLPQRWGCGRSARDSPPSLTSRRAQMQRLAPLWLARFPALRRGGLRRTSAAEDLPARWVCFGTARCPRAERAHGGTCAGRRCGQRGISRMACAMLRNVRCVPRVCREHVHHVCRARLSHYVVLLMHLCVGAQCAGVLSQAFDPCGPLKPSPSQLRNMVGAGISASLSALASSVRAESSTVVAQRTRFDRAAELAEDVTTRDLPHDGWVCFAFCVSLDWWGRALVWNLCCKQV